jgi:hypothetical protein
MAYHPAPLFTRVAGQIIYVTRAQWGSSSNLQAIIKDNITGELVTRQLADQASGDTNYWHRIATSQTRADPGGPDDGRIVVATTTDTSPLISTSSGPKCVLYVSEDFGRAWSTVSRDLFAHGCADVAVDATGLIIIVLSEWGRLFRSERAGAIGSFTELADLKGLSFHLATTPDLSRIIATSREKCAMISVDGGRNFRQLWNGGNNRCKAVAIDAAGQHVLVGLQLSGPGGSFYFSNEQGENLKEAIDGPTNGWYAAATMDDTGSVVFAANEAGAVADRAVDIGNGYSWAAVDVTHNSRQVACSPMDRCMTLVMCEKYGVVLAKKQRHCMVRDDPLCALTDESLAKPGDWYRFTRVLAVTHPYMPYSTISSSAGGHVAYTISVRDRKIFVLLADGRPSSTSFPAKRSGDNSEWRAIATNALISNPGSSLDGHFYALCTSDGSVYVTSTYRMWDDVNEDIKTGSGGPVACTHVQLSSDASKIAVLTSRNELWVANITVQTWQYYRLLLPAGSFRKVLSLTSETAHALAATPDFDSLVVTMSSSCALVSRDLGQTWQQPGGMGGSCAAAAVGAGGQRLIIADRSGSASQQTSAPAFFSSDGGAGVAALPGRGIYTSAATDATGSVFILAARDDVEDDWRKGTQMLFGDGSAWVREGPGFAARSVSCSAGDTCKTVWVATTDGIYMGKRTRERL